MDGVERFFTALTIVGFAALFASLTWAGLVWLGANGSLALTISIDRAIGPAAANPVNDALAAAGERRAENAQNVSHVDPRHLSDLHSEPKNEAGLVFPGPGWKKEDHQGRHDID
jgi:hypothetical protein